MVYGQLISTVDFILMPIQHFVPTRNSLAMCIIYTNEFTSSKLQPLQGELFNLVKGNSMDQQHSLVLPTCTVFHIVYLPLFRLGKSIM